MGPDDLRILHAVCVSTRFDMNYPARCSGCLHTSEDVYIQVAQKKNTLQLLARKFNVIKGRGWGKLSFDYIQQGRKYVAKLDLDISEAIRSLIYQRLIVVFVVALL